MAANAGIEVVGLRDFQRALKQTDRQLPKALRIGLNKAADVVVTDAKPRVPARSGRAAGTVAARSTQREARVVGGGNRAPYYPWLDFGGKIPRGPERPFLARGRYIYNAYFRHRDEFADVLADALVDVAEAAGLHIEG